MSTSNPADIRKGDFENENPGCHRVNDLLDFMQAEADGLVMTGLHCIVCRAGASGTEVKRALIRKICA